MVTLPATSTVRVAAGPDRILCVHILGLPPPSEHVEPEQVGHALIEIRPDPGPRSRSCAVRCTVRLGQWHERSPRIWPTAPHRPGALGVPADHVHGVAVERSESHRESLSSRPAQPGRGPALPPVPGGCRYAPIERPRRGSRSRASGARAKRSLDRETGGARRGADETSEARNQRTRRRRRLHFKPPMSTTCETQSQPPGRPSYHRITLSRIRLPRYPSRG